MSGIWLPDYSKLAINWKYSNDVIIFQDDIIVKFSWCCFVSLVKFSYWSKLHVNIITGSRVMTISFYKGLTRNLEIGNTPVWNLPNIWRLGWVRNTKFGTKVSNKMLLNAAKCQHCSFYHFWVIKGKPTGGGELKLPPPLWLELRKIRVLHVSTAKTTEDNIEATGLGSLIINTLSLPGIFSAHHLESSDNGVLMHTYLNAP